MKKFFSILAAVLFAGSMMATTVTKTVAELAVEKSFTNSAVCTPFDLDEVISVSTTATDANTGKYYSNGEQIRLYQTGSATITLTAAEGYKISSITLTYVSQNTGILVEAESGVAVDFENVQSATFTVGNSGTATNGQVRITEFSVTYDADGAVPPTPADTYTVAGNDAAIFGTSWDVTNTANDMVKAAGIYKWEKAELDLTVGAIEFKVAKNHSWDVAYPAQNYVLNIAEDGEYTITITFDPTTEAVAAEAVKNEPLADPTNCAEAREAALSVSANNELYNNGAVYSIAGYVTSIQTAYNSQFNNISFWIADAADGGNVIQAYRAACASAEDAPIVGDKVIVTGSLTKYNSTPEFAAGCTYVITEHATPVEPKNLGEKTIAEFLALANTVDTCVITGIVANIKTNTDGSYNKYGNFDLVDGEASVYVYGLLTADGVAQKFQEMGVDENDTLTVKAVYSLYNNKVQAKNAVFVAVKKAPVPEGDTIDVTISSITTPGALIWNDAVASEGWWQMMGGNENYEFSLSNVSTTETAGVYTIDDLDSNYSYITVMTATDTTDVYFVDGSVTVAISETGVVTIVGALVGDDGNTYNFDLTYVDPKAEKTVNVTISNGDLYDGYASSGLYAVYGIADDNTAYVQLGIWANTFSGNFTEEDLDLQYIGSYVEDATGYNQIYTAAITVTPGNGEGVYSITADLLCYNNTLYKVTMKIGVAQGEGVDNIDAAVKAIKSIVNGQLVIEKAGKTFNAAGQIIK